MGLFLLQVFKRVGKVCQLNLSIKNVCKILVVCLLNLSIKNVCKILAEITTQNIRKPSSEWNHAVIYCFWLTLEVKRRNLCCRCVEGVPFKGYIKEEGFEHQGEAPQNKT